MTTETIDQARELYKDGKREESRELLMQAIRNNLKDPDLWFALYWCVDDSTQKQDCLERTLMLRPDHDKAKLELKHLLTPDEQPNAPSIGTETKPPPPPIDFEVPGEPPANLPVQPKTRPQKQVEDAAASENPMTSPSRFQEKPKNAGDSTYELAEKRRWKGLIIGLGVIVVVIIATFLISPVSFIKIGGTLTVIFFLVIIFSRQILDLFLNPIEKRMRQARRGARAEVKIGRILADLGDAYMVIHDINADYGNIDHLVIGKDGTVFMIETKSHGGKITLQKDHVLVNGHLPEKDFIKQSLRNSYWLRDKIETVTGVKPYVIPILVFTNAMVGYYPPCRGVHLTYAKNLLKTIEKQGGNQKVGTTIWDKRAKITELVR